MGTSGGATYDLVLVKERIRAKHYIIRGTALDGAARLYFEPADIADCILALDDADFYKTMEASRRPGLWQDVYKPRYLNVQLYVKVQFDPHTRLVVIQFKKDESA